jgi:hypothetical protein
MKEPIFTNQFFSLKKKYTFLLTESLPHKITMVIKRTGHCLGINCATNELQNLNEYSSKLIGRIGKNYQSHQKKSNFVCVYSSANAYNLTHNEISENIEKCQKLSEARWNDQLIEYICNH